MTDCTHTQAHKAEARVVYLADHKRWVLELQLACACGQPFAFLSEGLPAGLNLDGAAVSVDGEELRVGVCPNDGTQPNPISMKGFTITFGDDSKREEKIREAAQAMSKLWCGLDLLDHLDPQEREVWITMARAAAAVFEGVPV